MKRKPIMTLGLILTSQIFVSFSPTTQAECEDQFGKRAAIPVCEEGDEYIPHYNCSRFYHCSNLVPICKDCPSGLYFNPNTSTCDFPHNVEGCYEGVKTTELPNTEYYTTSKDTIETTEEVPIKTTHLVSIETTQEVPVETTQEVPVETTQEVPVETTREVPVETTQEVPIETTREVPIETTQEVPVETTPAETTEKVPIETTQEVPVETTQEVPVETTREVPVETTQEVPIETTQEVPVETTQVVPIETTQEVPIETTQEVPIETTQEVPIETTQEVPIKTTQDLSTERQDLPIKTTQKSPSKTVPPETTQDVSIGTTQDVPIETQEIPTETTTPHSATCPPDGVHSIPHPKNCTLFYLCIYGVPSIESCTPGLLFDPVSRKCQNSDEVECNDKMCPEEGRHFLPYPQNCTLYIVCSEGEIVLIEDCYPGMLFDPVLEKCNFANMTDCEYAVPTCPTEGVIYLPIQGSCSRYVFCLNGTPNYYACMDPFVFHPSRNSCVNESEHYCPYYAENIDNI